MILAKHISAQMARKCAGSGLLLKHLDIAYKRNGLQGIYNLLSEPCANNKPHVISIPRVLLTKLPRSFLNKQFETGKGKHFDYMYRSQI